MNFVPTFLFMVIIFVSFLLLYFKFDKNLLRITRSNAEKLAAKDELSSLVNGASINNIPSLNIITNNALVNIAKECENGPVSVGIVTRTDNECIRVCANSTAHVLNITDNDHYYFNSTKLLKGAYCMIGKRPNCNMRTTLTIITINSVVCHAKFPEFFDSNTGNSVVACNDVLTYHPLNVLWDYKFNEMVDPETIRMDDVNEVLPDFSDYRFKCRFNGKDISGNKYMEHPYNRFHPIRNYCAQDINHAHGSVKTLFDIEKKTVTCDCGDYETTRVRNLIPSDPVSTCSSKSYIITNVDKFKKQITIPYKCFTVNSPITDVGKYMPCPPDIFINDSCRMDTITLNYTDEPNVPIEHPNYLDFPVKSSNMLEVIRNNSL